jgi:hypothetical protein
MNNDKMIHFVKRWRELERQQRDLDFNKSLWCRDLRREFPIGTIGENQFIKWCDTELGLTAGQASELLARAAAVKTVPDADTWKVLGGFRAIQQLDMVPKHQQVNVLEAAKSSGKSLRTVIKERGYGPKPEDASSTPTSKPIGPSVLGSLAKNYNIHGTNGQSDTLLKGGSYGDTDAHGDAVTLARYIARTGKDIPRDILKLIAKYTTGNGTSVLRRKGQNATA